MKKQIPNSKYVALIVLLILLVGAFFYQQGSDVSDRDKPSESDASGDSDDLHEAVRQATRQREALDQEVWTQETMALHYEKFFVRLWDRLRASKDALRELATVSLDSIQVGKVFSAERIEHDIELFALESSEKLTAAEWRDWVLGFHSKGYRLIQSEWHHSRFDNSSDTPHSTVSMVLHVVNEKRFEQIIIKGELEIEWLADMETPAPAKVDVRQLSIRRRVAEPSFRLAATIPATQMGATDFLAAYDFDGDGLSEIVFGNQLFRNLGNGNFKQERLARYREAPLQSAVIADFNGDGRVDLFCVDPHASPKLFLADTAGRFPDRPMTISSVEPIREFSTSITTGDVNADGYLDVWLTQYRKPYLYGQMPTPYYDANDGYPAYLLINDGTGNFIDRTAESGLASKRKRRAYSSSFVDLDDDGDLDLVVVSDFAGIDIYKNDGTGKFRDVTREMVDEPHTFGMSHSIADFDGDARLDLYVCGMSSTTARRLDAMHAGPAKRETETRMRSIMGYGNRMYLAKNGHFVEPTFREQVARTGWSWGVAELDFDNDGDRDIYVGNGHISGQSVEDYCSVFWRHDIYAGSSNPDPKLDQLFLETQQPFQSGGSWNGYEHNSLLMNQSGKGFLETAFLFGLAHEFDTRAIIADDIDADGLVDLLIVQHPVGQLATLQIWKNYGIGVGNWIGVVIRDQPGLLTPGTRVAIYTDSGVQVAAILNGDSFNCQHSATMHFGLGKLDRVERIEVTRPNRDTEVIVAPKIGRYHLFPVKSLIK